MTVHTTSFPKSATLNGRGAFTRVMDQRVREYADVLAAHAAPGGTGRSRLGISIGRKVGNAAARNGMKRLLREAFRLSRNDWPAAYDLVVVVRPHERLTLDGYRARLDDVVAKLHRRWLAKRAAAATKPSASPPSSPPK